MATLAIDFGLRFTKWGLFNGRTRAVEIGGCVPSAIYVTRSGQIIVGEAAQQAGTQDPAGAVDDLKLRLESKEIRRNRQPKQPFNLLQALLEEVRQAARAQLNVSRPPAECCLVVPYQFNLRQVEVLTKAAREAGFTKLKLLDEPTAAVGYHDRRTKIEEQTVVVCDLGGQSRFSVLCRRDGELRLDAELSAAREWPCARQQLSPLLLDALQLLATKLTADQARPLLLVVGGDAELPDLEQAFHQAGWLGRIMSGHRHAAVLGAVENPARLDGLTCPECEHSGIPKVAKACPECGFPFKATPNCPECGNSITSNTKDCPICGFPYQSWLQNSNRNRHR